MNTTLDILSFLAPVVLSIWVLIRCSVSVLADRKADASIRAYRDFYGI